MKVEDWTPPKLDFVDPRTTPPVDITSRGNLPHLYKSSGFYFVTFRVWDAVMPDGAAAEFQRLASEVRTKGDSVLVKQLAAATEPRLRSGTCPLRKKQLGQIVENALLYFHDERYAVLAWCVMPNHVHVVYATFGQHTPATVQHSWKSFTANRIN